MPEWPEWVSGLDALIGAMGLGALLKALADMLKTLLTDRREGQKVVVSAQVAEVEADKVRVLAHEAKTHEAAMLLDAYADLIKAMKEKVDQQELESRRQGEEIATLKQRAADAEQREQRCWERLHRLERASDEHGWELPPLAEEGEPAS